MGIEKKKNVESVLLKTSFASFLFKSHFLEKKKEEKKIKKC
jgi:hypothetical protein